MELHVVELEWPEGELMPGELGSGLSCPRCGDDNTYAHKVVEFYNDGIQWSRTLWLCYHCHYCWRWERVDCPNCGKDYEIIKDGKGWRCNHCDIAFTEEDLVVYEEVTNADRDTEE